MREILLLLLIILLILSFYAGFISNKKSESIDKIQIDTIIQFEIDTIKVIEKGKIRILKDTVIIYKPFVAELDTNIQNMDISLSYIHPANAFELQIIKIDTSSTFINTEIKNKKEINYLYPTIGLIVGFILGNIK